MSMLDILNLPSQNIAKANNTGEQLDPMMIQRAPEATILGVDDEQRSAQKVKARGNREAAAYSSVDSSRKLPPYFLQNKGVISHIKIIKDNWVAGSVFLFHTKEKPTSNTAALIMKLKGEEQGYSQDFTITGRLSSI
ncbi:hypothetical protein G9A89_010240 [Geosiphon pyriformis]|nr:hypothetical protein G9A89_010240 [Geosiphon pyriformis]